MRSTSSEQTGVMVVRIWIEADHETGLRARMTGTGAGIMDPRTIDVASSSDGICQAVKEWVDSFTALDEQEPG